MAFEIQNFGEQVRTVAGQSVRLDFNGDAVVYPSTDAVMTFLSVGVSPPLANEILAIDTTQAVSLSNGMLAGSNVIVNGTTIGYLDVTSNGFRINLNHSATPILVQEVVRALSYTSTLSGLVAEARHITITRGIDYGFGEVSVAGSSSVLVLPENAIVVDGFYQTQTTGTPGNDIFVKVGWLFEHTLNGGAGDDTLVLPNWYSDLRDFASISGIETLRGTSRSDFITVESFFGISTFDGGPNAAGMRDTMELMGTTIDLSGKTIVNFDVIRIGDYNAQITVSDKAIALLLTADVRGTHLRLQGDDDLTYAERQAIHAAGIDIITHNGETTDVTPKATGLDGDRIEIAPGQTVFLDQGGEFQLSDEDSDVFGFLTIVADSVGIGIDTSGRITLSNGFVRGSKVFVDNIEIGVLQYVSDSVEIALNAAATADRVEDIVHALTYTHANAAHFSEHPVQIFVSDLDERTSISDVTIFHRPPLAPTALTLSTSSVSELSNDGTTVGELNGGDPYLTGKLYYTLVDNAGGRFELKDNKILVGNGVKLDFEQASSHTITVKVANPFGASIERTLTILVTDMAPEKTEGSSDADVIFGGGGPDWLDGGDGDDMLNGGDGNDVLIDGGTRYLDESNDTLYGGGGDDLLVSSEGDDFLFGQTGRDTIRGGNGNDILRGGDGNDMLKGGNGKDVLDAGAGNDKLYGNSGRDVLSGGSGRDIFVFDTRPSYDKIIDYNVRHDTIWLDNKYMSKLGTGSASKPGKLNKKFFALDKAKDGDDRLIYDTKSGVLSFDVDGVGAARAVEIAILKPGLKMTAAEFFVI